MNSLKPFNRKYTIYTMECEYTANTSPADSDVIMFKNVRNVSVYINSTQSPLEIVGYGRGL